VNVAFSGQGVKGPAPFQPVPRLSALPADGLGTALTAKIQMRHKKCAVGDTRSSEAFALTALPNGAARLQGRRPLVVFAR